MISKIMKFFGYIPLGDYGFIKRPDYYVDLTPHVENLYLRYGKKWVILHATMPDWRPLQREGIPCQTINNVKSAVEENDHMRLVFRDYPEHSLRIKSTRNLKIIVNGHGVLLQ